MHLSNMRTGIHIYSPSTHTKKKFDGGNIFSFEISILLELSTSKIVKLRPKYSVFSVHSPHRFPIQTQYVFLKAR